MSATLLQNNTNLLKDVVLPDNIMPKEEFVAERDSLNLASLQNHHPFVQDEPDADDYETYYKSSCNHE